MEVEERERRERVWSCRVIERGEKRRKRIIKEEEKGRRKEGGNPNLQ